MTCSDRMGDHDPAGIAPVQQDGCSQTALPSSAARFHTGARCHDNACTHQCLQGLRMKWEPARQVDGRARPGNEVQGVAQIERQVLRCFLAVRGIQDAPGRAWGIAQLLHHSPRRPAAPEGLADCRPR